MKFKKTDLAYLAGILDGEGYFIPGIKSGSFGIRVVVIDEVLVEWLYVTFGGFTSNAATTKAGNQAYSWTLSRQDELYDVLKGCLPFLVIKKAQAIAMMALIRHCQDMPRWEIPTAYATRQERIERRKIKESWRCQREVLRNEIRAARIGYK